MENLVRFVETKLIGVLAVLGLMVPVVASANSVLISVPKESFPRQEIAEMTLLGVPTEEDRLTIPMVDSGETFEVELDLEDGSFLYRLEITTAEGKTFESLNLSWPVVGSVVGGLGVAYNQIELVDGEIRIPENAEFFRYDPNFCVRAHSLEVPLTSVWIRSGAFDNWKIDIPMMYDEGSQTYQLWLVHPRPISYLFSLNGTGIYVTESPNVDEGIFRISNSLSSQVNLRTSLDGYSDPEMWSDADRDSFLNEALAGQELTSNEFYVLIRELMHSGKYAEAVFVAEKAIDSIVTPRDHFQAWYSLHNVHLHFGHEDRSTAPLLEATKSYPDYSWGILLVEYAGRHFLYVVKDYDTALDLFKVVFYSDNDHFEKYRIAWKIALTYSKSQKWNDASEWIEIALGEFEILLESEHHLSSYETDFQMSWLLSISANIYFNLGNVFRAKELYETILELCPEKDGAMVNTAKRRLRRINNEINLGIH